MAIIKVETKQGKCCTEIAGMAEELIAMFAVIHDNLREKFGDAGAQKAFDETVDFIIKISRGG